MFKELIVYFQSNVMLVFQYPYATWYEFKSSALCCWKKF